MKHLRDQAKSAMAQKLAKYGGASDVKRIETGMPKRDGAKGYATGGIVSEDEPDDLDSLPAKPRLDRASRKKAGDKVNVNVIVMPKEGKADAAQTPPMGMPIPPPPPVAPPPMASAPPMPPPGLVDAAQGAPIMRAKGGRVDKPSAKDAVHKHEAHLHKGEPKTKLAAGGRAPMKGMDAGAGGARGRLEKIKKYGPK